MRAEEVRHIFAGDKVSKVLALYKDGSITYEAARHRLALAGCPRHERDMLLGEAPTPDWLYMITADATTPVDGAGRPVPAAEAHRRPLWYVPLLLLWRIARWLKRQWDA